MPETGEEYRDSSTVPAHTATVVVSATILPTTGAFDKNPASQADVSTTIKWNDAASVTDVKKAGVSIGASAYSVSGNTLTINQSYLATQSIGSQVLGIEFDRGNAAALTITVQDTTPPTGSNPPTWPAGSILTASGTTKTKTTLSWTPAVEAVFPPHQVIRPWFQASAREKKPCPSMSIRIRVAQRAAC